jgi:hypothetical protein
LREYCEHSAYENSLFTLRFLERSDDGKLWIVELPTSDVHEGIGTKFHSTLVVACPTLRHYLGSWGHATRNVNDEVQEPDQSYGPGRNVPNCGRPQNLQGARWLTFVVEVGRSQSWPSLRRKARKWYGYPGIEYVLLIKVDEQATTLAYEFYDTMVNPLVANGLPAVRCIALDYDPNGSAEPIVVDNRRLLGIPPGPRGTPPPPLPNGVTATVTIDLRLVLHNVNHTL